MRCERRGRTAAPAACRPASTRSCTGGWWGRSAPGGRRWRRGCRRRPDTFYFGGAGGGVWKTTDAGQTWRPLLQQRRRRRSARWPSRRRTRGCSTPAPGQVAARYDIMAGDGVYRSADGGETWTHVGLEATRHIGAILVDPHDPNRVLVAALGHVFGPNPERGVFLTTDGGAHWQRVLHPNDDTGAVDLAWDPERTAGGLRRALADADAPLARLFSAPGRAGPRDLQERPTAGSPGGVWRRACRRAPAGGSAWRWRAAAAGGSSTPRSPRRLAADRAPRRPRQQRPLPIRTTAAPPGSRSTTTARLASSYFGRVTVDPKDPECGLRHGALDAPLDRRRQALRASSRARRAATTTTSCGSTRATPTHMITGGDQGAVVTVDGGETWCELVQPADRPALPRRRRRTVPLLALQRPAGQRHGGDRQPRRRTARSTYRDWHPVGGDERDYMVPKPGDPDLVFGSGLGGNVSRFDAATGRSREDLALAVSSYGERPTTVKDRYTWITPLVASPCRRTPSTSAPRCSSARPKTATTGTSSAPT